MNFEISSVKAGITDPGYSMARDRPCPSICNNSLALPNWRLTSSHGNDLARGEVVKIPWIRRVVARTVGIREVVEHCVQAKIVEIRKRKAWTSVKEMVGRKVVEEDSAVSIVGIEPILVAHVEVIDPVRVSEIAVVAEHIAVGELKIINAIA
jgi:hypothetical protein